MISTNLSAGEGQNDESIADQLFEQGLQLFRSADFQSAILSYQQALDIYRKLNASPQVARVLNAIGISYYRLENYSDAVRAYQDAQTVAQTIQDMELQGRIANNLGLISKSNREYADALSLYWESLMIFQELNNLSEQINVVDNIGFVYYQIDDYEKAAYCYQYALQLLDTGESKDQEIEIRNLRNLVHVLRKSIQINQKFSVSSISLQEHSREHEEERSDSFLPPEKIQEIFEEFRNTIDVQLGQDQLGDDHNLGP